MGDDLAGVILLIMFSVCSLFFFYYGWKAITSREAELNFEGEDKKTYITGRWAVLIGTFMLVMGTFVLAVGIMFLLI